MKPSVTVFLVSQTRLRKLVLTTVFYLKVDSTCKSVFENYQPKALTESYSIDYSTVKQLAVVAAVYYCMAGFSVPLNYHINSDYMHFRQGSPKLKLIERYHIPVN